MGGVAQLRWPRGVQWGMLHSLGGLGVCKYEVAAAERHHRINRKATNNFLSVAFLIFSYRFN